MQGKMKNNECFSNFMHMQVIDDLFRQELNNDTSRFDTNNDLDSMFYHKV